MFFFGKEKKRAMKVRFATPKHSYVIAPNNGASVCSVRGSIPARAEAHPKNDYGIKGGHRASSREGMED